MAVAMMLDNPDGSQELYEKLRARLHLDAPAGGTLHLAGPSPRGGWRVVEVFDSVEAASRFLKDQLLPALKEAGVSGRPPEPEFWPVHNYMIPAALA